MSTATEATNDVLTVAEAAKYLHQPEARVRRWLSDGTLPCSLPPGVTRGSPYWLRSVMIRRARLDEWLGQCETYAAKPAADRPGRLAAARTRAARATSADATRAALKGFGKKGGGK